MLRPERLIIEKMDRGRCGKVCLNMQKIRRSDLLQDGRRIRAWRKAELPSKMYFDGAECYAICEREKNIRIGAVELKLNGYTNKTKRDDECESGYWLDSHSGEEAIRRKLSQRELLRHGFEDLGTTTTLVRLVMMAI